VTCLVTDDVTVRENNVTLTRWLAITDRTRMSRMTHLLTCGSDVWILSTSDSRHAETGLHPNDSLLLAAAASITEHTAHSRAVICIYSCSCWTDRHVSLDAVLIDQTTPAHIVRFVSFLMMFVSPSVCHFSCKGRAADWIGLRSSRKRRALTTSSESC